MVLQLTAPVQHLGELLTVGISMAQCWFMSVMSCQSSGWVVRYPISWMMQPQWIKCNLAENKQIASASMGKVGVQQPFTMAVLSGIKAHC